MARVRRLQVLDVELEDSEALKALCSRAKEVLQEASERLEFLAKEAEARLATVPVATGPSGFMGTANSRMRAKQVAHHLHNAAESCNEGAISSVKCWRSFIKHFAPELDALRHGKKPQFQIKPA